jgi:hypothetical protein
VRHPGEEVRYDDDFGGASGHFVGRPEWNWRFEMRKRLAVLFVLVVGIFGVAAGSAAACGGPVSCPPQPPDIGTHHVGIHCTFVFD